jgi:hypothetical protein
MGKQVAMNLSGLNRRRCPDGRGANMKRAVLAFIGLLLVGGAGGCAQSITNHFAAERAALSLEADNARVVLSAGAREGCLAGLEIVVARRGSLFGGAYVFANAIQIRSDYSDHYGTLNVIQLRAGDYVVRSAGGGTAQGDFTLHPGETVYLGELYSPQGCQTNNQIVMNDRWDRDMALLREQNPELAEQPITKRILELRTTNSRRLPR